jgi:citrate lyase subunit beta/citryl-CoA lyase
MGALRRTTLFVPGNSPGKLVSAGVYGADALIFDLEDSVAITEKDAARLLVRNAIGEIAYPVDVGVRINSLDTPFGTADLECILPVKPAFIRVPKAETAEDIRKVDAIIGQAEKKYGFEPGGIKMMATIESVLGVLNAHQIAAASPRMVAIALGAEDLTADLKTSRTKQGTELMFARGQILFGARAAGIDALDAVFSDVDDEEGLLAETTLIKGLGFDGKSVINPRQIRVIHKIFTPTQQEVDKAKRIVEVYEEACSRGSGVVSLDGKMIDTPVVIRAQRILDYAAVNLKEGLR